MLTTVGNDIIHSYGRQPPKEGAMYGASFDQAKPWIENYQQRLSKILDEIEIRFPGGCEIFLGNIYDPTDGVGNAVLSELPRWPDALRIHDAYISIIEETCATRPNYIWSISVQCSSAMVFTVASSGTISIVRMIPHIGTGTILKIPIIAATTHCGACS